MIVFAHHITADIVVIRKPKQHVRKASHYGSKQQ